MLENKGGAIESRYLQNGAINHGSQMIGEAYRRIPTTYFSKESGIGMLLRNHPKHKSGQPMRIAVVGLGIGTLAAYGQPGDVMRFYEINPDVIRIAQDPQYFTFLSDSQASIEVEAGDGRLSLERDLKNGIEPFDILINDAFSGDSIPTHLISLEAIKLYNSLLKPGGVMAFNISNRHVNMVPVLALIQQNYGLQGGRLATIDSENYGTQATWVLLTQDASALSDSEIQRVIAPLEPKAGIRPWTDDYSNLFQVLQ